MTDFEKELEKVFKEFEKNIEKAIKNYSIDVNEAMKGVKKQFIPTLN